MSDIKMKDGKVAMNDRDKYRQMAITTGNVLSVPEVLTQAFAEASLAFKWVSKAKIAKHGGYHPSNWIPYEITAKQKEELPKVFLGNVVGTSLERGDLILAVKPIEMQAAHKKEIKRKTEQQLNSLYEEKDAAGLKILEQPKE